jgi:hypothetical protein
MMEASTGTISTSAVSVEMPELLMHKARAAVIWAAVGSFFLFLYSLFT